MTRKEVLKKWFLTLVLSYIVICLIRLISQKLGYSKGDFFFIVIWTISYTLFYLIRNRRIILDRDK